jgi:hypothetical protein
MKDRDDHRTGTIVVDDSGFQVIDTKRNRNLVRWSEVWRIQAFKRDLFAVDLICFQLYLDGTEQIVEVDEQMDGFAAFEKILPEKFKGFDPDWFPKVANPAFAPNLTEIWIRP